MSKYTTSLELSKQLVGAGIEIKSYFWWVFDVIKNEWVVRDEKLFSWDGDRKYSPISACLTDELLEILPKRMTALTRFGNEHALNVDVEYKLMFGFDDNEYWCRYRKVDDHLGYSTKITEESLPNALAQLAIELKGRGLL